MTGLPDPSFRCESGLLQYLAPGIRAQLDLLRVTDDGQLDTLTRADGSVVQHDYTAAGRIERIRVTCGAQKLHPGREPGSEQRL